MAGGESDGFVIGRFGIAGIHHADRRDVHRRAAIDRVADTAFPRVAIAQLLTMENPLLGVEQTLDQQRLPLKFRHPPRFPGNLANHALSHVPRIDVALHVVVDRHLAKGHQGIVRDDAVAAHPPVAAMPLSDIRCHSVFMDVIRP